MAFGLQDIITMLSPGYAMGRGASHVYRHNPAIGEALFGTSPQQQRTPIYNQEQEGSLDQLLKQGMESVSGTGMQDLARKRFSEEAIPGIAERFTSMGTGGPRSSAFEGSLGRAGSDLEAQLSALGQQQGMQQVGMGLMPRYQFSETEGQSGMFGGGGGQIMAQLLPLLLKLLSGGM